MDESYSEHDYLTLKQFIARCPLSESTVRRWIKSGNIPSIQPGGENTKILIPADALARLATIAAGPRQAERTQAQIPNPKTNNRRRPKWMNGK